MASGKESDSGEQRAGLQRRATSGAYVMFLSSGMTFLLQFATTVILARIFTPTEFGLITSILVVVSYADVLWQAGVGQAIVQKAKVADVDISTAHYLTLGLGVLAGLLFAAAGTPLGVILGIEPRLLLLVALVFPLSAIGSVPLAIAQRHLKFRIVLIKDVLEVATYGVVGAVAGLLGAGLEGLILAVVAKTAIGALVPRLYARIPARAGFKSRIAGGLLRFGTGVSLSSLLNTTARNADYIVVLRTMDAASLGLYSRAYQLVTIPANILGQVIDRVLFPTLSRLQTDRSALGRVYIAVCAMLAAIYLPGGVLLYFLADEIVLVLLGDSWRAVADPLKALALFLFFRVGYKAGEPIAKALGAVYSNAVLQAVYAVLVFACAFFGAWFGLIGIAVGVGVALTLNYLAVTIYAYFLVRFRISELLVAISIPGVVQLAGFFASTFAVPYFSETAFDVHQVIAKVVLLILIQALVLVITLACWPRALRARVIRSLALSKASASVDDG